MRITSVVAAATTTQRRKPETTPHCATSLGVAFVRRTGDIKRSTTVKDNYYVWEELHETAILETDDKKLPDCLQAAKVAIQSRLQEIQADRNSPPEELQAIVDALHGLKVLRTELEKRT